MEVTPTIDKNALAKLFGSDDFGNVSRSTCTKIEKLEAVFDELIDPSLYHQNMGIDSVEKGAVHLEGGTKFKSPKLSKTLKDCDEIVCYIATLGDGIEGEINRLMDKNRLSEAYILDAMASVAADNMVETFHKRMKNKYENQSKQVTLCFSPGYCDWPVTEQKKFFNLVDSEPIGVELNDACLMTPRKSISGVFGIYGDDENGVDPYIPCSDCRKTDCPERRDF
jgi:Vitamin B12 dependent methionine synthase, activation domain